MSENSADLPEEPRDFIRDIVKKDLADGTHDHVHTRFPPEPNGYLHIGHAKSIHLNFGLAKQFGGTCNLRFDDTNPIAEDPEFVEAIERRHPLARLRVGGARSTTRSDYYGQLYEWAQHLIREGKAYVCELDEANRSASTAARSRKPASPARGATARSEESLDLLERMRPGRVPRRQVHAAREDRHGRQQHEDARPADLPDPPRGAPPHRRRTGSIYPMYDFAHGLSDAIEEITHSICTLEFSDNRALYDWFVDNCPVPAKPRQYEFARLNLTHTVMSKRKLKKLVTRWPRQRLGRSAPADPERPAPPRLSSGGDPRVRRPHRCGQGRQHDRRRLARVLHSRTPQPARAARDDRAQAAAGDDHQLARRPGRVGGGGEQPRGSVRGHAQAPLRRAALHRARRFPRGRAEKVVPPGPGQGSPPEARVVHHLPGRGQATRAARSSNSR